MPATERRIFPTREIGFDPGGNQCPICNTPNADYGTIHPPAGTSGQRQFQGWCPACSNFWISPTALEAAKRKKKAHLLSAFFREQAAEYWDAGCIGSSDWERLADSVTGLSVSQQFDETLVVICNRCPRVGKPSSFDPMTDWPIVRADDGDAAFFMVRALAEQGYLFFGSNVDILPPKPTFKAYERLEALQSSGKHSDRAFVAMSFSPSREHIWQDVIQPGIAAAGYIPIRVDKHQHSERIDDFIIAEIRRCRFLVADFTEQKQGIYFETGMALGLGRQVVWMCDDLDKKNLHFDTRQFNHILYTDHETARKQLTDRIVALEGEGPLVS